MGGQAKDKKLIKGKAIFFNRSRLASMLAGEHNRENIAAAAAVAKIIGVREETIKKAVASFRGLPHRLEFVRTAKGVAYFNDSFATTPEAAITALASVPAPVILLAGGAEKNSRFRALAQTVKEKAKIVILLPGQATPRLKRELYGSGIVKNRILVVKNMKEAVRKAKQNAKPGDTVLLSPACASFGIFKNYKDRGNQFKIAVKKI